MRLLAAAIGVLLGLTSLRLRGFYFAIATFTFSQLAIVILRAWTSVTGGMSGMFGLPFPTGFLGLDFSDPRSLVAVDDESAESYGRRTFGDEFTEVCMRPGLESLTLCPIGGTSKAIFLAQAQEGPTARFYSLTGGMGRLVEAMAAGVEVRTECPVRSIREGEGAVEVETPS